MTLLPDQSVIARGIFNTRARTGRFLVIAPPGASRLLWATVDQAPVSPLAADGRWLVPLSGSGPHRVGVFWSSAASAADAPAPKSRNQPGAAESSIELPRVGTGRVPALVTVHAPEGLVLRGTLDDLEPLPPDRLHMERADRIARQIQEFLAQMDRRSGRDRERVISLVIAHELALRGADRSLRALARRGGRARKDRAERDLELVQTARKALLESLRASALEDEIEAALAYLGQSPPGNRSSSSTLAVAASPSVERIRGVGLPTSLFGMAAGLEEPATRLSVAPSTEPAAEVSPERAQGMLLSGLLVALGALAAFRPGRAGTLALILAAGLGILGFLGGPAAATSGLLAAAAGCLIGPAAPARTSPQPAPA
jgi:hypothetical protein